MLTINWKKFNNRLIQLRRDVVDRKHCDYRISRIELVPILYTEQLFGEGW